jgi:hypothetical protein
VDLLFLADAAAPDIEIQESVAYTDVAGLTRALNIHIRQPNGMTGALSTVTVPCRSRGPDELRRRAARVE